MDPESLYAPAPVTVRIRCSEQASGCVWDFISPTSENLATNASVIPATFTLTADSGTKVWVNANATKHLFARPGLYTLASINEQVQLASLHAAISEAVKDGVPPGRVTIAGWELQFSQRIGDKYPVLIHALWKEPKRKTSKSSSHSVSSLSDHSVVADAAGRAQS
jgi:hypothetical protein